MQFEDCELQILRENVDSQTQEIMKQKASDASIKMMIMIVESFLKKKQLICYGGVSINAVLPQEDRIYNYDLEIPDYDFFSPNALDDAKELADIFHQKGFQEIEAKSGMHHGTYKVFVNFIPIADVTNMHLEMFKAIKKDAMKIQGVLYCPPNFLRMAMYVELSRPTGNIARWEKVLKRLIKINKHYPLKDITCFDSDFQRDLNNNEEEKQLFFLTKNYFVDEGVVFFGSFAVSQYAKYMTESHQQNIKRIPDFDVIAENSESVSNGLKALLQKHGYQSRILLQSAIGEVISAHYQVFVGKFAIAYIYAPMSCHSYNLVNNIKIATIDTMLSFYLAFLYTRRKYYNKKRILCMAHYLFEVQQKNRLEQKGLLKRFTMQCYGKEPTLEDIRSAKSKKYKELKRKYGTREYEEHFLRYRPGQNESSAISSQFTRKVKRCCRPRGNVS
jgi:hypothetical protein